MVSIWWINVRYAHCFEDDHLKLSGLGPGSHGVGSLSGPHICVVYAPNHRSPHLGDNGCGSTNAPGCNGTLDDDDTYIGTLE